MSAGTYGSRRHRGRVLALQVLYEVDMVSHLPSDSINWLAQQNSLAPESAAFAEHLVEGVRLNKEKLDEVIQDYAPEWPLSQIAVVDRSLLRIATFELLIDQKTPPKAVINDAVELGKTFGSEKSSKFINGVLGAVMQLVGTWDTEHQLTT